MFFILMQVKLMFSATKVLHLVLFLMWEFLELGNGLFYSNLRLGPILAVLIHFVSPSPAGMLLQSETKIEPDLRLIL